MTDVVDLLAELVRIGSVNPMGRGLQGPHVGEARLTEFLEGFFRRLAVPTIRQAVAPGRENLVAFVERPGSRHTLLFEAHQDTVPTDHMTIEPFAAEVRDGKLWGRGACDTKGGLAAMLVAVERLVRERPAGAASVIMACTADEEHQFRGVRRLLEDRPRATMAMVAEPTRLEVIVAHKGVVRWKVRTRGVSCHSAHPEQGVNAIYRMGPVVIALAAYAESLAGRTPHALVGPPTLSVGVIRGGTSVNTVPASCEVEVDRRLIPGEDGRGAYEEARRYLLTRPDLHFPVEVEEPWIVDPWLDTPADSAVARVAAAAVDRVLGQHTIGGVPYGTDASKIALAGIPAVVLGPGDIAQAHTEAEWIELEQVRQAAAIYYEAIVLAGQAPAG